MLVNCRYRSNTNDDTTSQNFKRCLEAYASQPYIISTANESPNLLKRFLNIFTDKHHDSAHFQNWTYVRKTRGDPWVTAAEERICQLNTEYRDAELDHTFWVRMNPDCQKDSMEWIEEVIDDNRFEDMLQQMDEK